MTVSRRLFLLRHAQASSISGDDKARSLTPKGRDDAQALGIAMRDKKLIPDYILCSSAMRTKQTLEGIQRTLGIENVSFSDVLYNGSAGDYLHCIQQADDTHQNILIVAHNPSIYDIVILLGGLGPDPVLQRLSEGYSPATLSVIECSCEKWTDIKPVENTLTHILNPFDYNSGDRPTRWM